MKLLVRVSKLLLLTIVFWGTSCATYIHEFNVGKGAQTGVEIKERNHYFLSGLAPGNTADPMKMAGDTADFSVRTYHSFVDGLIAGLTFGIYTPTTTVVTK